MSTLTLLLISAIAGGVLGVLAVELAWYSSPVWQHYGRAIPASRLAGGAVLGAAAGVLGVAWVIG